MHAEMVDGREVPPIPHPPRKSAGAGMLGVFATDLTGVGSTLALTLTANLSFEAMLFDNIV